MSNQPYTGFEVAIIGVACRVGGADDWRSHWNNLINGVESSRTLSVEELQKAGMPQAILSDPDYVNIAYDLQHKNRFDSHFFDYTPSEAHLLNPVHRIFHECAWEALEDAGYDPDQTKLPIGVYAGANDDLNWKVYSKLTNVQQSVNDFYLAKINDKDYLTSLISYKLDLKGPSISINTACSTSLVAIHTACKALVFGETKMALAGGIALSTYQSKGYVYQPGSIFSQDGHCRPFDQASSGTVDGEGVGIVVLKRLADAIKDGDNIYAVIKGSAVNNDGKRKVGYTAPSIEGQVDCIRMAQKFAKVEPESISYIETHGTATKLGDSIEVEALNIAFKRNVDHSCAIGSVKSNIGHLDIAAGVAGLIKTTLSLKHRKIPASLHYHTASDEINFSGGPFHVNASLCDWKSENEQPLRAGVSSFGVGGTNAHIILEEAPKQVATKSERQYKLVTLSAKTNASLERYLEKLSGFLKSNEEIQLDDMAYTYHVGRKHFRYRKSFVFENRAELLSLLDTSQATDSSPFKEGTKSVVFLFSGQGSQYLNMGKGLYDSDFFFRSEMDKGFELIHSITGEDFKSILFSETSADSTINQTRYAQALIFLTEYSLSQLLISYGVTPQYMIGHSIGEYVAACLDGVFSFEDGIRLVLKRGELMYSLAPGVMLSVSATVSQIKEYLNDRVSLAGINGPEQLVLSGDREAIELLSTQLKDNSIPYVQLHTSHAFHSSMQDSILESYRTVVESVRLNALKKPFISNLTGNFIKASEATSADYWVRHLRETVQFSKGIETLLSLEEDLVFVEVGAGHSLSSLVKQHFGKSSYPVINLIRTIKEKEDDTKYFTNRIGRLWSAGVVIDWNMYHQNETRRRISLPTYSFELIEYPSEVNSYKLLHGNEAGVNNEKQANIDDWFYRISWKTGLWHRGKKEEINDKTVLVFSEGTPLSAYLVQRLTDAENKVITVDRGNSFDKKDALSYVLDPKQDGDIERLIKEIKHTGVIPQIAIHLWDFTNQVFAKEALEVSVYHSLVNFARHYSMNFPSETLQLEVVANGWYKVHDLDFIHPSKAIDLGAIKTIPLEFSTIKCRAIDISDDSENTMSSLWKELNYDSDCAEIALRGKNKYLKSFEKLETTTPDITTDLRKGGCYIITGASGGMGHIFATYLASEYNAKLILIGRSAASATVKETLEKLGAEVAFFQMDIGDEVAVSEAILLGEKRFGSIHGVIHTAGVADYGGIILRRKQEDDLAVFNPKVKGTEVLIRLLGNRQLDFFVNCSSQNASLPFLGQVAYIGANLFQDAVAEAGTVFYPIISIEWDTLKESGMASNSAHDHAIHRNQLVHGITNVEAIRVLLGALYMKIPTTIISTRDFLKSKREYDAFFENMEAAFDLGLEQDYIPNLKMERPTLNTPFVEATSESEKTLQELFVNFFGIDQIGIQDDFFELGGDSLKAMVILKRIQKQYGIELSLNDFFEHPSIESVAKLIDETIWLNKKSEKKYQSII
ncbi:MAG: type I polyketide synthase [Fluviicola sp.]|nr:type I polyketide synthase [Fluviicola sp.]